MGSDEADDASRRASALLLGRGKLDEKEARYATLVAEYGGNRRARRKARAEVNKKRGSKHGQRRRS